MTEETKTASIQIISDIHLEFYKSFPKIKRTHTYLCLAGDIGNITSSDGYDNMRNFLEYCSQTWVKTFFVFGNHEFYPENNTRASFADIESNYIKLFATFSNVYLLNNSSAEVESGLNIYGTTLWTHSIVTYSPRHLLIDVESVSREQSSKLIEYLNQTSEPTLIMTHFPPVQTGTSNPKYDGQTQEVKNYFAWEDFHLKVNAEKVQNIKGWISGHTHWSYDFEKDGVHFISNQFGYKKECVNGETGFDENKQITVSF